MGMNNTSLLHSCRWKQKSVMRSNTMLSFCCLRAAKQQSCSTHKANEWQALCFAHLAESGTRRTRPEVSLTPSTATTASHRCARRVPRLGLNMPAEEAGSGEISGCTDQAQGAICSTRTQKWPLIQPYWPQLAAVGHLQQECVPQEGPLVQQQLSGGACGLGAMLRYVCQHGGQAAALLAEA